MLIETQYFPCIQFWAQALKSGTVKLEKYENYQKRSYRNKCLILAANGVLPLTVPLKSGKNNKKSILDVEISYEENWQKSHITSIKSAYTSSPYYEFYIEDIEQLIMKNHDHLYDLNRTIIEWFSKIWGIKIEESTEYKKLTDKDLRHTLLPKNRSKNLKSYVQVFSEKFPFETDLSILDLVFCKGPEAKSYLSKLSKDI